MISKNFFNGSEKASKAEEQKFGQMWRISAVHPTSSCKSSVISWLGALTPSVMFITSGSNIHHIPLILIYRKIKTDNQKDIIYICAKTLYDKNGKFPCQRKSFVLFSSPCHHLSCNDFKVLNGRGFELTTSRHLSEIIIQSDLRAIITHHSRFHFSLSNRNWYIMGIGCKVKIAQRFRE